MPAAEREPIARVRAAAVTDPGHVRSSNQDYAHVGEVLVAVADGMGGHAGGEVAARTAIEALEREFTPGAGVAGLVEAVQAANRDVFERAAREPELRGMGTTLTAAALVEEGGARTIALVNVGDSRAYLLTAGRLRRLTEDHSVVEEMVRSGELTEAEAAVHPHRHIVTRAIGIDRAVDIDAWDLGAASGRLLLCSDGLTNECSEDEIAEVLSTATEPDAAARALVERALEHGGGDNVTVVVADLDEDRPPPGAGATEPTAQRAPRAQTAVATTAPPAPPVAPPSGPRGPGVAAGRDRARPAVSPARGRLRTRPAWAHEKMVTIRVFCFVVVLLGIVGGAVGFITWFNDATYFVGMNQGRIVVYEGRPGGMLWFKPVLVYTSHVPSTSVLASNLPLLKKGVLESSYGAARATLRRLGDEQSLLALPGATTTTTTSTLAPGTAATTTTTAVASPPEGGSH